MAIRKISISNFKGFKDLDVELGKFNVLIGANASGKSNFIQLFKFLRDIINSGLDNAISMQGGVEYLRNINIGASQNLSVEVISDLPVRQAALEKGERWIGLKTHETIYKFALKFTERGAGFKIAEDKLTQKCELVVLETRKGKIIKEEEKLGQGEIILSNIDGKLHIDLKLPEGVHITPDAIFPPFLIEEKLKSKTLLLETPFFFISMLERSFLERSFSSIPIYDFDPKLSKKAAQITGKAELEEDGSNLAIVLKNIIKSKAKKRKLSNLVRELLPFVDDLDIQKLADKSLLFKLRETYAEKQYLPASLLSDGTIRMTALIITLYFEEKPSTIIIEEPERNIHPHLLSKVISMMKEASQKKQIIVTTHNPEIVRYAGLENILLVSRDKEGFSTVYRPGDKDEVRTFLQNEIGIEELYVQNLLDV